MKLGLGPLLAIPLVGLLKAGSATFIPPSPVQDDNSSVAFDWATVQSSRELRYHKCYGSFECARLEVPLDWSNLSNPHFAILAIARLPAVVDVADPSFGGTIVVNPGGPSGSGLQILAMAGPEIQTMVDSEKHFEILSFDPRGVQFSTPSLACFQDDAMRTALAMLGTGAGTLESNQHAMDLKWSSDKSLGLLCEQTDKGRIPDGSNIRQFVSTTLVAHDMVEIIDQVEVHRRKQLGSVGKRLDDQQTPIAAASRHEPPLLNYWGLSYGTYLGNTFASLFPDRIGRMVLDGVVDADDYAKTGWTSNLQDNNKTWATFFQYCFDAGSKCALFEPGVKSPGAMQSKAEQFLAELKHNPIPLVFNGNALVLTYFDMKRAIHALLYFPGLGWPFLAANLAALMKGNLPGAMAAWESAQERHRPKSRGFAPTPPLHPFLPLLSTSSSGDYDPPIPLVYPWQQEALISILCGDGDDITSRSKSDFAEYLALLESQSPLVGSLWAEITLNCIHWPMSSRPSSANRFTGPFKSNLSDYDRRASPLLFIGNTADPVTPLRNAFAMSARHEGSVVFTQDLPGHCAGTANPSVCTLSVLKTFFANGTLPEPGLVCEGLFKPWDT